MCTPWREEWDYDVQESNYDFMAKMASLNADEMVQGKTALKHISNCSHFNSISPQFHLFA